MTEFPTRSGCSVARFAVLTTAIGAGFAGSAQADFVSTAGGNVPTDFTVDYNIASPQSLSLDLNGDGTVDYTISSSSTGVSINGGTNLVRTVFGNAIPVGSLADFVDSGSLKTSWGAVSLAATDQGFGIGSSFDRNGNTDYLELVFDAGGQQLVGYLAATLTVSGSTGSQTGVFTLTDYGYDAVPEPASLALLATGAAGLLQLRRRRAARPS